MKAMELYSEVAILHLVRFAITPKDSELPAATDWFFYATHIAYYSRMSGSLHEPGQKGAGTVWQGARFSCWSGVGFKKGGFRLSLRLEVHSA